MEVVDRQVPGQVSLCEAWRVAFRRALEALDLTLSPSMFASVFYLEKILHVVGST